MRATSLVIFLLVGCTGGDEGTKANKPDGETTSEVDPTTPANPIADQISIGKISAYQAVESILWAGGAAPSTLQAPVLEGRDATARVFLRPEATFVGGEVTVELTLSQGGADVSLGVVTQPLGTASVDDDLGSTFNFDLAADQLTADSELRVTVTAAGVPGESIVWDSATDLAAGLPTGETDDLTVVVIPIQYDGDGSGRLPDVTQARLDELRDAMYAVYPASSVTVRVGDTVPYASEVSAFNPLAWQNLLNTISAIRGEADETPNTYYYGMFMPDDDFYAYCVQGCILGLSELGFNTTNPSLRTSIGLSFSDIAASTMVHELGHAHGRFHAPCGGAAGADPNYPYPDALIGSWGYDLLTGELKDPSVYTDIMGYCPDIWISNYTYYSLWERIAELGTQTGARVADRRVTKLSTDGHGHTEVVGTVRVGDPTAGGLSVEVDVFDAAGAPAGRVPGWFFPNSHFAGGGVTLDRTLPEGWTAEVHGVPAGEAHLFYP
jgi:hypothetical protein